ncbi:MAG: hypothetical protein NTX24_04855 [Candidatus Pacearchaeota archaeon]|nr:hypothetical protein [Candidatus Pacearchaeota archaeon]
MSYKLLIKKLMIDKKKIITREELKEYCKNFKMSYSSVIGYLLRNRYAERILRGIFYLKSIEERKLNKSDMSFYEAIKEALRIKGVKNWYFGLESAIKLNNLTHEYFAIDFIISDKIKRKNTIEILGHKVKFLTIKKELIKFGIEKGKIPYSDIEKTILDIVYLGIYRGYSESTIRNDIIDYIDLCDKAKLINYAKHYPKTILKFIPKTK